jgi:hypothetical protein
MNRSALVLPTFALLAIALTGCGHRDGNSPTESSVLSGTLSGRVVTVQADGTESPALGVLVTIDGSTTVTVTDSTGFWSFPALDGGTYTIDYSLVGYGLGKSSQVSFVGGGNRDIGFVYLCKAPSFGIAQIGTYFPAKSGDSNSVYLNFVATDTSVKGPYRTALFVGKDSTVSSNPAHYATVSLQNGTFSHGLDSLRVTPAILADLGLTSGDTAYMRVYAANAGADNSGYTDLATDRYVYTNIDSVSALVKFVVP